MKNNMTKIRGFLILILVAIVFSVVAFAIPFARNGVFWSSYIFTMVAILLQAYVFHVAFNKGEPVKSKLYGFPIARIGVIYLIVQLITGILFMAFATVAPPWLAILVFVVILCLSAIGFIAADMVRDEVESQDAALIKNVSAMRTMQATTAMLANQCTNEAVKKELGKLAEEFRFSDPVSNDQTEELETQLTNMLIDLRTMVSNGQTEQVIALAASISSTLKERNFICKTNKH